MRHRFVGRAAELGVCQNELSIVVGGRPRVVVVTSEPGGGKTRLLDAFRASVPGDVSFATVAVHPLEGPLPLFLRLIHQTAANLAADGPQLRTLLGDRLSTLMWPNDAEGSPLSDEAEDLAALERIAMAIAWLGRRVPCVLVVEDLDQSRSATRGAFTSVALSLESTRVLLIGSLQRVGTREPQDQGLTDLWRSSQVRRIDLEPLNFEDIVELSREALGRLDVYPKAKEVLERSGGNPLLATILLDSDSADVPHDQMGSLREIVLAPYSRLSPAGSRLVEVVALARSPCSWDLLRKTWEGTEAELIGALRETIDRALLTETEPDVYALRHGIVAEYVIEGLLGPERRTLHRKILKGAIAMPVTDDPRLLAHHAFGAGDEARALVWATAAAEQAKLELDFDDELAWREKALEAVSSGRARSTNATLREIRGAARAAARRAGEFERVIELCRQDLDASGMESGSAAASLLWEIADALLDLGRYADAEATFRDSIARATARQDALVLRARLGVLEALFLSNRFEDLADLANVIIEDARSLDPPETEIERKTYVILAQLLAVENRMPEAFDALERALPTVTTANAGLGAYRAAIYVYWSARRFKEAVDACRDGLAAALRLGLRRTAGAEFESTAADICMFRGDWDDAVRFAEGAIAHAGQGLPAIQARLTLAELHLWRGDQQHLPQLLEDCREITDPSNAQSIARLYVLEAWLQAELGNFDEAMTIVETGLEALAPYGDLEPSLRLLLIAVEITANAGTTAAKKRQREAIKVARARGQDLFDRARTLQGLDEFLEESDAHIDWKLLEAEFERSQGRAEPERWHALAERCASLSPPLHAYVLLREAEALLIDRRTEAAPRPERTRKAKAAIDESRSIADRLGAKRILKELNELSASAFGAPRGQHALHGLTLRQYQVWQLLAEDLTNEEIASRLFISKRTVDNHVAAIFRAKRVRTRRDAAELFRKVSAEGT